MTSNQSVLTNIISAVNYKPFALDSRGLLFNLTKVRALPACRVHINQNLELFLKIVMMGDTSPHREIIALLTDFFYRINLSFHDDHGAGRLTYASTVCSGSRMNALMVHKNANRLRCCGGVELRGQSIISSLLQLSKNNINAGNLRVALIHPVLTKHFRFPSKPFDSIFALWHSCFHSS